jgi:aryl-alcohol dehydrogenase-like predicted oxidoreductase
MQVKEVFDRCEELGLKLLNTCEFYGADNHNEQLIGRHTAQRAEKFHVRCHWLSTMNAL